MTTPGTDFDVIEYCNQADTVVVPGALTPTEIVNAWDAGADFVDLKHCHGYLLHEFLSAFTRPGKYGGAFENRTRILREIVATLPIPTNFPLGAGVTLLRTASTSLHAAFF